MFARSRRSAALVIAATALANSPSTPAQTQTLSTTLTSTQLSAASQLNLQTVAPTLTSSQLQLRFDPQLQRIAAQLDSLRTTAARDGAGLDTSVASRKAALDAALAKDPRYAAFNAEATRIASSSLSGDAKVQALRTLAASNQALLADGYRNAGIGPQSLLAAVPGATLDGANLRREMRKQSASAGTVASGATTSAPTARELVFVPPFSFSAVDRDNGGLAYVASTAAANRDTGVTRATGNVVGVVGGTKATADVGQHVVVPEGFRRVEFVVSTKRATHCAALGAVVGSGCTGFLSVSASNDSSAARQYAEDYRSVSVFAPYAWFSEDETADEGDVTFGFDVPAGARNYTVMARAYSSALGGGLPAWAGGAARTEMTRIRVRFIP